MDQHDTQLQDHGRRLNVLEEYKAEVQRLLRLNPVPSTITGTVCSKF